jgi:hypothetical protein
MHDNSGWRERSLEECLLFGMACVGLLGGLAGIVLSSSGLAVTGAAISLLTLLGFLRR